jgi:hypothetical protein
MGLKIFEKYGGLCEPVTAIGALTIRAVTLVTAAPLPDRTRVSSSSDPIGTVLGQMAERKGPEHYGAERLESEAVKAERLIAAGLKQARWSAADLTRHRKGHPVKVRLAQQLRTQTTLTVAQIADHLAMGSRGYAVQLLWRAAHRKK